MAARNLTSQELQDLQVIVGSTFAFPVMCTDTPSFEYNNQIYSVKEHFAGVDNEMIKAEFERIRHKHNNTININVIVFYLVNGQFLQVNAQGADTIWFALIYQNL
jgi:hypothetical protein